VNRLIPDDEIEGFADAFARRIATFDKAAVAGIKKLVDVATLPEDEEFAPRVAGVLRHRRPSRNRPFVQQLFETGLQQANGIETELGSSIGKLRRNL
jgi:hypothetical protein